MQFKVLPYRLFFLGVLYFLGVLLFLGVLGIGSYRQPPCHAQQPEDSSFLEFGIFEKTAPRPPIVPPVKTQLPLELNPGERIAFIGNTLFERMQQFGNFETMLHMRYPNHRLVVRNLAWSADAINIQPRPENFADIEQHLYRERIDVVFAAYGFNESFDGVDQVDSFRERLVTFLNRMQTLAFNGRSAPKIVLLSPIANENKPKVPAANLNNARIDVFTQAMRDAAGATGVGFVDLFSPTQQAMASVDANYTTNGCHLNERGDSLFAKSLYQQLFRSEPPLPNEKLRQAIIDRDRQYARRFRPLNTFYYTGDRNKQYGYLDFLPAMRSFEQMVANRDERIWAIARGETVPQLIDDSNVPPMPPSLQSRGVNEWLSPQDEQKAFQVDPRFEVNLFASEEEFPEIANPIQMRFDAKGRMWVSTSITYPHIYPGNEPQDRIVILEDTNQDGRADKSTIFASNLHVPLSFELGDGGVYVSEQPELTWLKDTDGDDRMDQKTTLLSGFGTEDSHHALHDFTWSPEGDLIIRESIFHHSQIETPYGPVRQQNSGWFRYTPRTDRLISFGSYPSTNPWGVTFDDWGRHVASHPIFAAAFHSLDPPYPGQHPSPNGLQAYSGTCGHQFVDSDHFPPELRGAFIKARYKPTNRIEMHQWVRQPFGFEEQYMGDLIFSTNLSFIPVDLQFGPRGDLYICDWYNPVKGHAQYSLRDTRRDRSSGRIWRVTAKNRPLVVPPTLESATISQLLEVLKRPEYMNRYRAKRELRGHPSEQVVAELKKWIDGLDRKDPRFRHHQLEALWSLRTVGHSHADLLRELIGCESADARAAAVQQLRYGFQEMPDALELLQRSIHDADSMVRMEAAIAASYIGTEPALKTLLEVFQHPMEQHLSYAVSCSLGSHTLRPIWEADPKYGVERLLKKLKTSNAIVEPKAKKEDKDFDERSNVKTVRISCEPERMLFTVKEFTAAPGQPLKIVFTNPDATDHNLVIVKPGALAEVGMAANDMAKDPKNANSDFIPSDKKSLILHATPLIGTNRKLKIDVLRFEAPSEPGVYPYVCTFPGHWIIMNGNMIVGRDEKEIESLRMSTLPKIVRQWAMSDFEGLGAKVTGAESDPMAVMRGMQSFTKANCTSCHQVAGHGVNLGPTLSESIKKLQGAILLRHILEPSWEIHPNYKVMQYMLEDGRTVSGVVAKEEDNSVRIITNLLTPDRMTTIAKKDIEESKVSALSAMPTGLIDVLTKEEILDLLHYLESGPLPLMNHDEKKH
jgi:putative heme-binding domain-containing protein